MISPRASRGLVALCLVLPPLALLWKALFLSQALLPADLLVAMPPWRAAGSPYPFWNALIWDSMGEYFPWRDFAARALHSGHIPLWNPFQFCGTPFLANGQSALFYPPNLLFWLFDTRRAFGLSAFLHLVLAGWFAYLFLRSLRLHRLGAVVGAMTYALNGYFLTWIYLPTIMNSAVWLPLALLFAEKFFRRGRLLFAVAAGAALGLSALAGHPQVFLICTLFFIIYFIARALSRGLTSVGTKKSPPPLMGEGKGGGARGGKSNSPPTRLRGFHSPAMAGEVALILPHNEGRNWLSLTLGLLLAGAFALLLAAGQLLPLAELLRYSHRGGGGPEGYHFYLSWALPWQNLITLLAPDFFGNPTLATFWGKGNYAEYCVYAGILPLGLAILAVVFGRGFHARFFAISAAVWLLCAFGTPLNWPIYHFVPGMSRAGSPARLLLLYHLSVAVLAGFGVNWLVTASKQMPVARLRPRLLLLVLALAVLPVALAFLLWQTTPGMADLSPADAFADAKPNFTLLVIICISAIALVFALKSSSRRVQNLLAAGLVLLVAADLLFFGARYIRVHPRQNVYPAPEVVRFLQRKLGGERFLALSPTPLDKAWPASDLSDAAYMFRGLRPFPRAVLPPNSAMVYSLRDALGYDSLYLANYRQMLGQLVGRDPSPPANGNLTLADSARRDLLTLFGIRYLLSLNPLAGKDLRLVHDGETKVYEVIPAPQRAWISDDSFAPGKSIGQAEIVQDSINHVRVMAHLPAPGYLVVADGFYPGWRATAAGKELAIRQANEAFRAVRLPAGTFQVDFHYRPASFKIGLFCFLLAVAIAVAWPLATVSRNKQP